MESHDWHVDTVASRGKKYNIGAFTRSDLLGDGVDSGETRVVRHSGSEDDAGGEGADVLVLLHGRGAHAWEEQHVQEQVALLDGKGCRTYCRELRLCLARQYLHRGQRAAVGGSNSPSEQRLA